ncbi:hypothetical protein SISSUDRAFT_1055781 [Sistotremastrum suecicum HHB10207 ss-3]|uniref:Protein kinase domain-containing protein n=1 Tax=Sistotremastrum suecicum HHB10207 ss-3 TaxID=1314776 RepID=A0A165XJ33_9AGAM|nr:hypothetical protein SISSUDRAFT_1055781 [Sistotremastrum suecicum HHB10207 ss-3]
MSTGAMNQLYGPQDLTAHIMYSEEFAYAVASGGFADIFRAKYEIMDVAVKVMRSHFMNEEKRQKWSTVRSLTACYIIV